MKKNATGYPVEYICYSSSKDLTHYRSEGSFVSGENVCVLPDGEGFRIYHAPENGIACQLTRDFLRFSHEPTLFLGQKSWPWARERLTAGFILDGRFEPGLNKYLLFFHGDESSRFPWCASIGVAWSEDLRHWEYR